MKADDENSSSKETKDVNTDEILTDVKFEENEQKPLFLQVPHEGVAYMIKGIILENEALKGRIKTLVSNQESAHKKATLLSEEFAHLREIRKAICQKYENLTTEYDALSTEYDVLNKEFHEEKKILLVENNQLKRKLSCMQDERKVMKSKVSRITKDSIDLQTLFNKECD